MPGRVFLPVCLANIDHLLSFMYVELVASHQLYFFFPISLPEDKNFIVFLIILYDSDAWTC